MMKLFYAAASPFARKVVMMAHELDLADQLDLVLAPTTPVAANPDLAAANPLGKLPTLVLENGQAIYDSGVILHYLDALGGGRFVAREGAARWAVMTEHAAADGVMDAALLIRYEVTLRPDALRWEAWSQGQMSKIHRALDLFETAERRAGDDLTMADIGVACALGYLDFRFPDEDWRAARPNLTAFHAAIAKRPSYIASDPNA